MALKRNNKASTKAGRSVASPAISRSAPTTAERRAARKRVESAPIVDVRDLANGAVSLRCGDCRDALKSIPDNSIDAVVTDPPYALESIRKRFGGANAAPAKVGKTGAFARVSKGFMGQAWDTGEVAFDEAFWREVCRVVKPGGYIFAFSGTRTYHHMAVAIERAGFDCRDQYAWTYATGMPKSHDAAKGINSRERLGKARTEDMRRLSMGESYEPSGRGRVNYDNGGGSKMNGSTDEVELTESAREWKGYGTAVKPAWEPIFVGRKPLIGTVAQNVLAHGVGALNIDGCRIEADISEMEGRSGKPTPNKVYGEGIGRNQAGIWSPSQRGRFPANLIHDGSPEVVAAFPTDDKGLSASRFFFSAKAGEDDRLGFDHPTVKPVALMRWLVRHAVRRGGVVLDPFAGTGTTGQAAVYEGCRAVLVEREERFQAMIEQRMKLALAGPEEKRRALTKPTPVESTPLFEVRS